VVKKYFRLTRTQFIEPNEAGKLLLSRVLLLSPRPRSWLI